LTRCAPGAARITDVWTRRLLRRVDAVVCASEFAAAELQGHTVHQVHRVPLGVDLETFAPPHEGRGVDAATRGIRDEWWSGGDLGRVIYLGRLSSEKCPHDALAAIELLHRSGHQCELLVVGDGPLRIELERCAADLPVRFTGHIRERTEIAMLLRTASLRRPLRDVRTGCARGAGVWHARGRTVRRLDPRDRHR
jgi:alpha-1,6-mannosyltransferase